MTDRERLLALLADGRERHAVECYDRSANDEKRCRIARELAAMEREGLLESRMTPIVAGSGMVFPAYRLKGAPW